MLWKDCPATLFRMRFDVLDLAALQTLELASTCILGGLQDAIEPAQDGHGQHHILVLVRAVWPAQQVGHRPDETDFLAEVVHVLMAPDGLPLGSDGR